MSKIVTAIIATTLTGAVVGGGVIAYQQLSNSNNSNTNINVSVQQSNTNTAQPFKNNLLGTWVEVDNPKTKVVFTAAEMTAYEDGKVPEKTTYTRLSDQAIEIIIDSKKVELKLMFEGDDAVTIIGNTTIKLKRESGATTSVTAPAANPVYKLAQTLTGHSSYVMSVAFSPDGKTLASSGGDTTVKLWDAATGTEIKTLKGHGYHVVLSVAFSPDGKTIASGSHDQTIKLWNVADGKEIRTLTGHSKQVRSVAFSPDGTTLASGSEDRTIKLWNVADGKEIRTLTGHSGYVMSVAFSPDGKTLASASNDDTVKLWDAATGTETQTLTGHSDAVWSVAFSPDGKTLASASYDKTIKLWRAE